MKKVSVYVKGDRSSTAYYRIYQYFDRIDDIDVSYHLMYPLWVQKKFMPVPSQNILMQIIIFFCAYMNVLFALMGDMFYTKDVIVIHKRLLSRYMPVPLKWIVDRIAKKGTRIIWDFDDNLVVGKEMSRRTFEYLSDISDKIVVTHEYLKSLVPERCKGKVFIVPTTDGDMYKLYENKNLLEQRIRCLKDETRLVWVATSSNIKNLMPVIPYIDEAAELLAINGRKVSLKIICDKPVKYETKALIIENIKWSREAAIEGMKTSHIGIMPLLDIEYNKGKGGFKLVQYISVGLPCIGSDIGYNKQVISKECGVLTRSCGDWVNAVCKLSDYNMWKSYSENANKHWQKCFSFELNLKFWKDLLE